ncbi:MAG: GldM family protein [Bacteroidales bacterium]|nr:GldM family protein [Bacteroidales bacterium]MDD4085607.1 GldM family protein [Bacteroidales bacterium]
MAGYKETPRQKMIGMMYLVLTAMLALNVAKDILDAFLVVNDSMEITNQSFATKIAGQYAKFETQYNLEPVKVEEYWAKAGDVRQKSYELIEYIEDIKIELVARSERMTREEALATYFEKKAVPDQFSPGQMRDQFMLNLNSVPSRDKYDEPTNYLIGQNKNGKAYELAGKMKEYRTYILDIIGPQFEDRIGLVTTGKFKDASGTPQDWEYYNFYHTILAADITLLNKIIAEVQTAEFDAVNTLYANITEKDFKFDNVAARVIPKSTFILQGQAYEAEILVAAYDSKTQSQVKVLRGADKITDANIARAQTFNSVNGTVKLEFPGNTVGPQSYAGVIEMLDPRTQELTHYEFSGEYIVSPPALTVSPLKMNVLYAELKNPIAISSPGIASEMVTPSISKGKLTKRPDGTWDAEVPIDEKLTTITASASIDGKTIVLGSYDFRIKRVPKPNATIAAISDGKIDRDRLLAANAIIPELVDFDFEDYYYEIVSYELETILGGDLQSTGTIRSNRFNDAVLNTIRNSRRGQKLFFMNIQAKSPTGRMVTLNPISLEIQ